MRQLVPARLRYLELEPGPREGADWLMGLQFGGIAGLLALGEYGKLAALLGGPAVAAVYIGVGALVARRRWGSMPPVPVAMAFTPWGVVLDPNRRPTAVHWLAISDLDHERIEGRRRNAYRGERPADSVVRIVYEQKRHVGKRDFESELEGLEALWRKLAREQARPVALGLEPGSPKLERSPSRAFATLHDAVRAYLASEGGQSALFDHRGGYRERERVLRPEAKERLLARLREPPGELEHAPFAAVLAAELGVVEAIRVLAEQILTPHPFVAAVLKAAALRLGAPPMLPGTIDEVRPFLPDEELDALSAWVKAPKEASASSSR
jgi:hypothetical protein